MVHYLCFLFKTSLWGGANASAQQFVTKINKDDTTNIPQGLLQRYINHLNKNLSSLLTITSLEINSQKFKKL